METSITKKLDELGIAYKLKPHKRPAYTSEDAARERGVHLSQIVKTMLLENRQGHTIVAVLPGDKKLHLRKLKKIAGVKDLRFADCQTVEKQMGFVVGAIAPVGELLKGMPIFADPAIFSEAVVDISSGDPAAGVEIKGDDLRTLLADAEIVEFSKAM